MTKQDFDEYRKEMREEFKEIRTELKSVIAKANILTGISITAGAAFSVIIYINGHNIKIEEDLRHSAAIVQPAKEILVGENKKVRTSFN